MTMYNLNLYSDDIDLLSTTESRRFCYGMVSQMFDYLHKIFKEVPWSDKSFIIDCDQHVRNLIGLFAAADSQYSDEGSVFKSVKICEIICTIMKPNQEVQLFMVEMDPLKEMEPFVVTRVLATTVRKALCSLSKRVSFSMYMQKVEKCIQLVDVTIDRIHKLIFERFDGRKFIVHTSTIFPSIIVRIEREDKMFKVIDGVCQVVENTEKNK